VLDAWLRTGRASVRALASSPVKLRSGLVLAARPAAQCTSRLPLGAAQLDTVQDLRALWRRTARVDHGGTGIPASTLLRALIDEIRPARSQ